MLITYILYKYSLFELVAFFEIISSFKFKSIYMVCWHKTFTYSLEIHYIELHDTGIPVQISETFLYLSFFFFFFGFGIEESQRTTRRKRIKGTQKEFRLSIQNQSQLKLKLNHSTTNMNFLVLLTLNFALTTGAIPAPNPNPNAISSRSSVAAGAMNLVSRAETIFEKRGSSCGQMCFEQGDCIGHCSYCDIDKDSICSMFIKCLSKKKKKKKNLDG